ncbi:MAG: YebC/PmpR family DNA-binding transcriptional regulator [Planctomycetota bacterium]|nr:YebC/PmpR family DNA-binding transcriptional regulator [Planctomycetota bacterium]MEC9156961.1 YebC/PmpR family DNA-binding transcriptional regulator [Planctomycetota bacterium]MED5508620.1 YebC/PmpR family DNA-binding transcriptional regulator [Planctomycetota bacterium]
MAGHSKWANIKHRKGRQDAKRGKIWSRCSRAIIVAAQQGGADPEYNVSLRYAIEAAKSENMPKDNIAKAIKKGAGLDGSAERYEEIRYEGYGPAGVALIVDTLVANPQKTAPEIRSLFDKNNGKLGQTGSVSFGFDHQGEFFINSDAVSEEALMELALEAGAEDVVEEEGMWQITCPPADFLRLKEAIESSEVPIESSGITWSPQNTVPCDVKTAGQILRIVDAFEDHDDVQAVYHNAEIPVEALEA